MALKAEVEYKRSLGSAALGFVAIFIVITFIVVTVFATIELSNLKSDTEYVKKLIVVRRPHATISQP